MADGFFLAYSALDARMKLVDIIANNLANSQTNGFKRQFGKVLEDASTGFEFVSSHVDLAPGYMLKSGSDLDAAIESDGFFAILTPDGVRYTRNGSFVQNSEGELATQDGMKVLSSSDKPISSTNGAMSIQDGGAVTVNGNEIATLKIVHFADLSKLQNEGAYRFDWKGGADEVLNVPEPRVKAGYLERSNVNAVNEMVRLISANREYEAIQRTIKTLSVDMNSRLIQEFGRQMA